MNIVKIEDGFLEQNDYFLTSKTTSFLGDGVFSRTPKELSLINGYIERNFEYKDFVIMIDKKPDDLTSKSNFSVYTRKDTRRNGIKESHDSDVTGSATNWKIVQYEGFIQTYISYDYKQTWIACGGGQIREYSDVQGFYVEGDTPLRITKYNVYRNPYVRLFDIDLGYTVKLVDKSGTVLDEQVCESGDIQFLLQDEVTAKFIFYDKQGMYIEETDFIDLKLGDSYINLMFEIDLYYGSLIERYNTTRLHELKEIIQIKNSSLSETYTNVTVNLVHTNTDTIQISLDGISYDNSVTFESLAPQDIRDIHILITKDKTVSSFGKRSFVLEIE